MAKKHKSAKNELKDAVIAVTYNCNSRCRMCNIWQMKDFSPFLRPEELRNLPDTLESVNITGGEPFLRSDLPEIIKTVKKQCPKAKIIISSNGFATDLIREQMEKIFAIDPEIGVAISLDGIGKAHDEIRGIPGGFDKAGATINYLKKLGVKYLKIGFTLGDYNTSELAKVYAFVQKNKLELSLAIVHSSENYFSKNNLIEKTEGMIKSLDWLINEELKSRKWKNWARAYFAYGAREYLKSGNRILPDYSGKLNVFIDSYGNVFPCDVSTKKIGTLDNFREINFSEKDCFCEKSWMVCTARQAIKKHFIKAGIWIISNKLRGIFVYS